MGWCPSDSKRSCLLAADGRFQLNLVSSYYRPKDTAVEAVRSEVREALYDLADLLLAETVPNFARITNAVVHLWYLLGLAEDDQCTELLNRQVDRLSQELGACGGFDRAAHAAELRILADSVWARWCV
jgi:hypothetical protein